MVETPVLEVYENEDGIWEAIEPIVYNSNDIQTKTNLDKLPTKTVKVLVSGNEKNLKVYLFSEGNGWITWQDAYS